MAEVPRPGPAPIWVHPQWAVDLPWLVQGTTARGGGPESFDLGLFGALSVGDVLGRWRRLREAVGLPRAVHARQVHGAGVLRHAAGPAGLFIADDCDGHVTAAPGTLLTVSVADCIPVSIVDPDRRAVALVHAGWRGVAAGIVEHGIMRLAELGGSAPASFFIHFGPAICGHCYEVGPEVHAAIGRDPPSGPRPIDLRAVAAGRAEAAGIPAERMTVSAHCTRCGGSPFFSHRAGCGARQVGVLGILGPGAG